MKYPTVSALCEGVAGAIREKEGSTALINPQDFPDRIKGLEVGGASGSKMFYLKRIGLLPGAGEGDKYTYSAMSQVVRYEDGSFSDDGSVKAMIETGSQALIGNNIYPIAFGFDPNTIVFDPRYDTEKTTLWEKLTPIFSSHADCFEPITEEQFYDLNTLLSE